MRPLTGARGGHVYEGASRRSQIVDGLRQGVAHVPPLATRDSVPRTPGALASLLLPRVRIHVSPKPRLVATPDLALLLRRCHHIRLAVAVSALNLRTLSVGQAPSQSWYSGLHSRAPCVGHLWKMNYYRASCIELSFAYLLPKVLPPRPRQPSFCPWTQCLVLNRTTAPFRRNRARDLIFKRDPQRCGDGASPKRPVYHSHRPRPQLPPRSA